MILYDEEDKKSTPWTTYLNPKNWGVRDLTHVETFPDAWTEARNQGLKDFIWNDTRYNTKYAGDTKEEMTSTGITQERIQGHNPIRARIARNIVPRAYGHTKSAVKSVLYDRPERPIEDAKVEGWLPTDEQEAKEDSLYTYGIPQLSGELPNRTMLDTNAHIGSSPFYTSHFDALNLTMGYPQDWDSFRVSDYKPTDAKDPNATYYKINDDRFKRELITKFYPKKSKGRHVHTDQWTGIHHSPSKASALGHFTVDYGSDERGDYISYYDINDYAPMGDYEMQTDEQAVNVSPFGKPLEIYDRVYYKDYGGDVGVRRMYYTDDELLRIESGEASFDTKALQRELQSRGHLLENSTSVEISLPWTLTGSTHPLAEKYEFDRGFEERGGEGGSPFTVQYSDLEALDKLVLDSKLKESRIAYNQNKATLAEYKDKQAYIDAFIAARYKGGDEIHKERIIGWYGNDWDFMNESWETRKKEIIEHHNEYQSFVLSKYYKDKPTFLDGIYGPETEATLKKELLNITTK